MNEETLAHRYKERARENENLREWLIRESYMTVAQVAEHLSVSESTVRGLPAEVLPVVDLTPNSANQTPRYHPEDVMACRGVLQNWRQAVDDGREDQWLAKRRERLTERANLEERAPMMDGAA